MNALIAAGGRGIRARPKTARLPKVMLPLDGKPILQRSIELVRDSLGIKDITLIVGYRNELIQDAFGDGRRIGVALRYVHCSDPAAGLAEGMLSARGLFDRPFVTVLGDEVYLDSNHQELRHAWNDSLAAVCGLMPSADPHLIRSNYGVSLNNDRITALTEKPQSIENNLLGCGTFVFTPAIFEAIERTPRSARSGKVELIDVLDRIARQGGAVAPFFLTGTYFNVNTIDDYHDAQYALRASRFAGKKISVVIPAYNEEASIGYVVRDFKPLVHEVLVVDNSSQDRTSEVAAAAGARVEKVRLIGYGDTIRYGLDRAAGDILVVVEGDFSFRSRDLARMLEYLKEADMIVGTRTTREMIQQGANMRGPVRWGNVIVAKFVEALWWSKQPRFTDVGCTYRALWKDTWHVLAPYIKSVGPDLSPEMMVAALALDQRIIEIPVSYRRRIAGESKHSASYIRIARTALLMLKAILRWRFAPPAPSPRPRELAET